MKRIFAGILILLLILLSLLGTVLAYNTLAFTSLQLSVPPGVLPAVNRERATTSLQEAIRLETLSPENPEESDPALFLALHRLLEERYPLVHSRLEKEVVSELSLLYTWRGSDPGQPGIILMAHQDVVPASEPETWRQPAFSGALADGYVWGRGTLDDKGSLIGIFEAVETLLERDFQPDRNIYLCFGHDEEIGGWNGAATLAATLRDRGIRVAFALDEGMAVVEGAMLGLNPPIAFVALTEKGYLSLELTAQGPAGHSSTPPRETTLGILAKAVARLEACPMPANLPEPIALMFRYLGPEMGFPMNMVFANLWLTRPIVLRQLASSRMTDAAIRTTTAVTIMEGGTKDNVLPPSARAVVNLRPKPGESCNKVTDRVRDIISDARIAIAPLRTPYDSPPMSRVDTPEFEMLHKTIRKVFPDALFAPSMMLGGSDSHHYSIVTDNIYRFSPVFLSEEDIESIHGPNERISVENFCRMISFYIMLLEDSNA